MLYLTYIGQDVAHQHSHTVRLRRSKLLLACHKYEDAIHDCKQCLLEKPRHPETYLVLVESYVATGQHNEVILLLHDTERNLLPL